jgi:hypothetical protein
MSFVLAVIDTPVAATTVSAASAVTVAVLAMDTVPILTVPCRAEAADTTG